MLANLTWEEISEIKREDCIVLIPLGSTEQQGSHLTLGVDTYVAERVAMNVAKKQELLLPLLLRSAIRHGSWSFQVP